MILIQILKNILQKYKFRKWVNKMPGEAGAVP